MEPRLDNNSSDVNVPKTIQKSDKVTKVWSANQLLHKSPNSFYILIIFFVKIQGPRWLPEKEKSAPWNGCLWDLPWKQV